MDEFASRLKEAIDIREVIGSYLQLSPSGGKLKGLCPFHEDHSPSLIVDPQYRNYRCWSCGAKGDVFTFVQEIERISFSEALERLAERAGMEVPKRNAGRTESKRSAYQALSWASEQFEKCLWDPTLGAEARAYLTQRGLREETVRRFSLGFSPLDYEWLVRQGRTAGWSDRELVEAGLANMGRRGTAFDMFRGRLLFPIKDERGRVLGFGGRQLASAESAQTSRFSDSSQSPQSPQSVAGEGLKGVGGQVEKGPKYLNSRATSVYNKSEVLYGMDVARAAVLEQKGGDRTVVVMEGYTDCLMAYQEGFANTVATCGTALTARHVAKLGQFADRVVLMFDGDAAGLKAARASTGLFLSAQVPLQLAVVPDGLDPCDFLLERGKEAFHAVLRSAREAIDFLMADALSRCDQDSLAGRRQAVEEVLGVLATIPELATTSHRIALDLALSQLAHRFGFQEETLRRRLSEFRTGARRVLPSHSAPPVISSAVASTANSAPHPGSEPPPAPKGPPSRRERELVDWLVAWPERAAELRSWAPPESIQHPKLRRMAETIYRLVDQIGSLATAERVRQAIEELNDPDLDSYVEKVTARMPPREDWEQCFVHLLQVLTEANRERLREMVQAKLAASDDVQVHLELLRQLREHNAL